MPALVSRMRGFTTRWPEHEPREGQLLDVTTAISQELQLKPLLHKIMDTVTTLEADRSTLFLHDDSTDELWSQVARDQ